MQKKQNKLGFTMAELLVVVAIIAILGGVAFIGVINYQRNMAQLECDSIAKELFVAAQNHLTAANSQGYLNLKGEAFGQADPDRKDVYYFINNNGNSFKGDNKSLLDLMLPFGSIDETVRIGGNYIICYKPDAAQVVDVFYCSDTGRFKHSFDAGELSAVSQLRDADTSQKSARRNYGSDRATLGWYGDTQEIPTGKHLEIPEIRVVNAERLYVVVKDPISNRSDTTVLDEKVSLFISMRDKDGNETAKLTFGDLYSAASARISSVSDSSGTEFTIVLDDITTSGLHFADLNSGTASWKGAERFTSGKDIYVQAVAFRTQTVTNLAYTDVKKANSLFAELGEEDGTSIAYIDNIRHLENLAHSISDVEQDIFGEVRQLTDLDWNSFVSAVKTQKGEESIKIYKADNTSGTVDCFCPIDAAYTLNFNGQNHKITNVKVNQPSGNGGLFGTINNIGTIKNLRLIDFDISSGGNVGALAGEMKNSTVQNVITFNTRRETYPVIVSKEALNNNSGVGGLIGNINNCTLTGCAAAVYVKGTGSANAGGLIGFANKGTINGCYSGGHTSGGAYDADNPDVQSSGGNAGGLIGTAESLTIKNSYSTCSAKGYSYTGGLVGQTTSASFENCYSTGLVTAANDSDLTKTGAFAGSEDVNSAVNCHYFEIINEVEDENADSGASILTYMTALGNKKTNTNIKPLDETAETYNTFVGTPSSWKKASPYDSALPVYYRTEEKEATNEDTGEDSEEGSTLTVFSKYPLRTAIQLFPTIDLGTDAIDFVLGTHYGDWPAPEIFVINTPAS